MCLQYSFSSFRSRKPMSWDSKDLAKWASSFLEWTWTMRECLFAREMYVLPNFLIATSVLTNSTYCKTYIIDLMSMMSMSKAILFFFIPGPWVTAGQVAEQEHRERDWTSQQDARVERWHAILRAQLPRQSHSGLCQEFPNHSRQWPWVSYR